MILAANQPYFFPYLGYWQLINAADLFLIADNLAFIRKGWIKRNRILINGSPVWFSLKVRDASSFRLIMDTEIVDALRAHPGLDVCAHRVKCVQDLGGGRQKVRYAAPSLRSRVLSAEEVIKGGGWYVSTPSLMCRREVFLLETPMRKILTMDYVLQIQASLRGGMYYMEDCMAVYRKLTPGSWSEAHPHGLSSETRNRMLDELGLCSCAFP